MDKITLLIADDHPVFRAGLRDIIRTRPGFSIVAEAGDGQTALETIRRELPRIAVLDFDMPKRNGIEIARDIQEENLPVAVIILTMYDEEDLLQQAMESGVMGFILKDSAVLDILKGIDTVASNRYFVSPSLAHHTIKHAHWRNVSVEQGLGLHLLTPAERNILHLISLSKSSREIADVLCISEKTVENHRAHICTKLNLTGSFSLMRFALEHKADV